MEGRVAENGEKVNSRTLSPHLVPPRTRTEESSGRAFVSCGSRPPPRSPRGTECSNRWTGSSEFTPPSGALGTSVGGRALRRRTGFAGERFLLAPRQPDS